MSPTGAEARMTDGNPAGHCSNCREPAVILDRGQRFCAGHLVADVENRVRKDISEKGMIAPGDRLAVALSGGKDSTALLLVLSRLLPEWQDVTLTAITIDEGIAGYREETLRAAEKLTEELGVPHRVLSFADVFGKDLDSLVTGQQERGCTICGVLRRKALEEGAREIGATKIVTGHNADDEAQSVLMNLLRGDLARLIQDSSSGDPEPFVPRIKPLSGITEKEVLAYLFVRGFYTDLPECPYAQPALRSEIREMLAGLEDRHPGTREALLRSRDVLRAHVPRPQHGKLRACRECGGLSSGDLCRACQILRSPGS
jgi:uncharacterized protein (TIGR00269 family)